jgi:16S rRNA (cytidine1402-2'-O)-methyltransferase
MSIKEKYGSLFLIPNTLGEEDRLAQIPYVIPPLVAKVASELESWIVENAKTARNFLSAVHQIHPLRVPLQEIKMQVWKGPQPGIDPKLFLEPLIDGVDVGLMSEAGLPAIADPGAEIVAQAHLFGISVKPMSGPSSLMLALMGSGMNGQSFSFHGYLPIKNPERSKKIKSIEAESRQFRNAHLWIETPYRNTGMLTTLIETLSINTQVCMAIDLTLPSELIIRHSVKEWQERLAKPHDIPLNLDKRPAVFILQAI